RQPRAAARRQDLGRAAQRPARRRTVGDAADPAGTRRAAHRARTACPDPGGDSLQPAFLTPRSLGYEWADYYFAARRRAGVVTDPKIGGVRCAVVSSPG